MDTQTARSTIADFISCHIMDIIRDPSRRFDCKPRRIGSDGRVLAAAAALANVDVEGIYIAVDLDVPAAYVIAIDNDGCEHDLARIPIASAGLVWY